MKWNKNKKFFVPHIFKWVKRWLYSGENVDYIADAFNSLFIQMLIDSQHIHAHNAHTQYTPSLTLKENSASSPKNVNDVRKITHSTYVQFSERWAKLDHYDFHFYWNHSYRWNLNWATIIWPGKTGAREKKKQCHLKCERQCLFYLEHKFLFVIVFFFSWHYIISSFWHFSHFVGQHERKWNAKWKDTCQAYKAKQCTKIWYENESNVIRLNLKWKSKVNMEFDPSLYLMLLPDSHKPIFQNNEFYNGETLGNDIFQIYRNILIKNTMLPFFGQSAIQCDYIHFRGKLEGGGNCYYSHQRHHTQKMLPQCGLTKKKPFILNSREAKNDYYEWSRLLHLTSFLTDKKSLPPLTRNLKCATQFAVCVMYVQQKMWGMKKSLLRNRLGQKSWKMMKT